MERIATNLEGCWEIRPRLIADDRGTFVKTFHRATFEQWGLPTDFPEAFYSVSRRGVLRGLHFQLPPAAHAKLVTCVSGKILDAAVDLRQGSPTYGRHALLELSAEQANMLYVPVGLAHGFYALTDRATVLYNVTTMHAPALDTGIRWDSAGIPWPEPRPVVSARDAAFPSLSDFQSPFTWGAS